MTSPPLRNFSENSSVLVSCSVPYTCHIEHTQWRSRNFPSQSLRLKQLSQKQETTADVFCDLECHGLSCYSCAPITSAGVNGQLTLNLYKYVWQFLQIHLKISVNTVDNFYKYIWQFGQINWALVISIWHTITSAGVNGHQYTALDHFLNFTQLTACSSLRVII